MPKRWTLFTHPEFNRTLRLIPRGLAGLVSEAISTLATNPFPSDYEVIDSDKNRYRLKVYSYLVYYEVIEETSRINLLLIEEET